MELQTDADNNITHYILHHVPPSLRFYSSLHFEKLLTVTSSMEGQMEQGQVNTFKPIQTDTFSKWKMPLTEVSGL